MLILSMQDDPRYVREAFDAGASGYVLKEAVDTDVVAAVREVAAGGRYVHPALGARMVAADAEERKRAEQDPLSDREREVLRLLALGHTNQEIAGSSTSRCARPRRTARTSCRSCGSRPAPSSSATRSSRGCSRRRTSSSRRCRSATGAAHDQHRSPRLARAPRARRCRAGRRDRAVAARADDDQVGVVRVGEGDDLVDGVAAEQRRRRDEAVLGRHVGGLVEHSWSCSRQLVRERAADAAPNPVTGTTSSLGTTCTNINSRRVLGRELDARTATASVAGRRAVGGDQDPLHRLPPSGVRCLAHSIDRPARPPRQTASVAAPIAAA